MDYSIEHAKVKSHIEKSQCVGDTPRQVADCITEGIKTLGYVVTDVQLLDANVDPVEKVEDTRFVRVEARHSGVTHIFTFAVLKPGGVYRALWLQSAVVEK